MRLPKKLAVVVVLFPSIWLKAQLPPGRNPRDAENAAVKYLRADAALRQSYPLPPDAAAKLQESLQSPLDGEDEKLVAAADEALVEFHHGAAFQRCDWAVSMEDGPLANTAHRGAIMELVAVAGLRARLRFRDGNTPGGMHDALGAMAGARHLSVDGSLASVLFAYKLEKTITEVLAQNLHKFSPEQLRQLTSGLDDLPKGSSLGTAFESEKVRRNDLLEIVQGIRSREELIERLVNNIPVLRSDKPRAAEIVDGCGGSAKGLVECINRQQHFYALWAPRFALRPEEFEREYKAEIEDLSKANPVIRVFTPSLSRLRWTEAYCQTRRALLRAAIAAQLDGQSALDRHLDPYDGHAFSYISEDGGFRLESRLTENGTPISLSTIPNSGNRKLH